MKYRVVPTSKFKKEYKRALRRGAGRGTGSVLEAEGNRSRMGRGSLSNPTQQEIFHWIFPQFPVEIPSKSSEFSRNFQWKFAAFPLENLSKEA